AADGHERPGHNRVGGGGRLADPQPYWPGTATPAGWSFLAESPMAGVPVPAGFVVEIMVDTTGFRVADRLALPSTVGKLIRTARGDSREPVILLIHGKVPTGTPAELLFGALADALGCPVIAADDAVAMTAHGFLHTAGVFRQWQPAGGQPSGQRTGA